jgi:murein DD-endopeptidase MepM/ murein hydrolase activator NlpD
LLRFDLSGLPQSADAVYLYLYPTSSGTPTNINWYLITNQWQSGTVNSTTNLNGAYIWTTGVPNFAYWYTVNITSIYNQWRLGGNYGLQLKPVSNNNNYTVFRSSTYGGGSGPWLRVDYTPQANDSVIKLKWPLGTNNVSRVVGGYHWDDPWISSCGGYVKKHNGTDYSATAGWPVYAAEDGVVREKTLSSQGWRYNLVMEHNHPVSGKYTTVYWHVEPLVNVNDFVPKGMQIATVANLATGPHLHFGLRIGAYSTAVFNGTNYAGTGGLPQTNCQDNPPTGPWYPAFSSSSFISPENTSNVLFQ